MGSHGLSNRSNGQQYFGVTEPLSLSGPTEFDIIKTWELEKIVHYEKLLLDGPLEISHGGGGVSIPFGTSKQSTQMGGLGTRKKEQRKFQIKGYALKVEALEEILSFLYHFEEAEDEALSPLLDEIEKESRNFVISLA